MSAMALTFAACSSEDEVAQVNPTFDGKNVKAEFALNIPGGFTTRMQEAKTQGDNKTFRGINKEDLFLYAFQTATAKDADPVAAADVAVQTISLNGNWDAFDHAAAQDKWYNDVVVPVGTNAFLVYAKAPKEGADNENGVLTMAEAVPGTPDALKFDLKSINTGLDLATEGQALLAALNSLPGVTGKYAADKDAKAWNDFDGTTDNKFYYDLYQKFIKLTAGSKTSVEAFLKDLENTAEKVSANAGDEGIDKKLAAAVTAAIAALGEDFTAKNNMPDGAAVLEFKDGKFSFVQTQHIAAQTWGVNDYTYPAELWYRVNTGVRTAEIIKSTEVGEQKWDAFVGSAYAANSNAVTAASQSIALVNPLQYAVANLETQIKFAKENMVKTVVVTENETTGEKKEDVVESIPVSSLELTGILVGDQKGVDWQFLPREDEATKYQVVYDTDLIKTTFGTAFDKASETLVLESAKDGVNVALEFVNNSGKDFTGVNGIIPAGTKFYLIGKLEIANGKKAEGSKIEKIFQQDYKTIAKFTINTLENNAYNTIPDLRTPELEFGLSVDLEWQPGFTFEIAVGEE